MPPKKKEGGILKRVALLMAGALLSGAVLGATMVGVNVVVSRFTGDSSVASAGPEEKEDIPKAQTESRDSGQGNDQGNASQGDDGYQRGQKNNGKAVAGVSNVVERVISTVVAVTGTTAYQSNNYGYGWFFRGGPQTYEMPSNGSGIVTGESDKELLIVTSNHVVEDSASLRVTFTDSEAVDTAIKGTNAGTNLAVVAVPLKQIKDNTKSKIKVVRPGNSDELRMGQGIVAIDNAPGYGQSVTVGYVSAFNRGVRVSNTSTRELPQTDAAISPGDNGDALLDMRGEVIDTSATKYSSIEVEGVGCAIPTSETEDIMNQLMNRRTTNPVEEARRGYLGIQGTSVNEESVAAFGVPGGVYVYKILEKGAVTWSDPRGKGIITKVDDQSVQDMTNLQELLACYEMGEQIDLTVQTQKDEEYQEGTATIVLKTMPQENTKTQIQ